MSLCVVQGLCFTLLPTLISSNVADLRKSSNRQLSEEFPVTFSVLESSLEHVGLVRAGDGEIGHCLNHAGGMCCCHGSSWYHLWGSGLNPSPLISGPFLLYTEDSKHNLSHTHSCLSAFCHTPVDPSESNLGLISCPRIRWHVNWSSQGSNQ